MVECKQDLKGTPTKSLEFIKQDLKGTPTESLEFIKPFERHTNQITGIYQTISQVQLYCNLAKNQSLCYHIFKGT
jgi:hypothetical protein